MPLIPGISYPITSSVTGPLTLNDNQMSPMVLFAYPWNNAQNSIINFSIQRGTINEVGSFMVSTDGTNISFAGDKTDTLESGVVLNAVISGSNIEVQYISTSTGHAGQFWYSKQTLHN